MSRISEWILLKMCRPLVPGANPWSPPPSAPKLARFRDKFSRDISPFLEGRLLEIGSGNGILAGALRDEGYKQITATDYWELFARYIDKCRVDKTGIDFVRADGRALPFNDGSFETLISEDGFEHFLNPEKVLAEIRRVLRDGGTLLVTFGPPWLSPRGGHMMFLNAPPWFHLIFSDQTIFNVRSKYRDDGVRSWTEGYSPLNKITISQFRRMALAAGLKPREEAIRPVRGLNLFTGIPLLGEFCSNLYAGIWQK